MNHDPMSPATPRLVRAPHAQALLHRDTLTVLARSTLRFDGPSAELCRAVIEHLSVPRTREALFAHISELAGAAVDNLAVVDQLLAVLTEAGAITEATPLATSPTGAPRRVVLAVSGAIAAAHTPSLALLGLAEGWTLRLAATRNALRFVAREALEAIAHCTVHSSHWHHCGGERVPHLALAEWAEVVLVAPASATTLSRIAQGDCSDVVSATAIATRAPVLLAPSMNPAMYASASVQRNLRTLRDDGFYLALPAAGLEVAHTPDLRRPTLGPSPSPTDLIALVRAVLALSNARRS